MLEQPWFQLCPDEDLVCPVRPAGIPWREYPPMMTGRDFARLQDRVGCYEGKRGLEFCDFLFAPTFMVGKKMIALFRSLAPAVETKSLTLLPAAPRGKSLTYWIPYLPSADCLEIRGDAYRIHPECLQGRQVARYEGKHVVYWFFSLAAAEQILARGPLGVHFVKVPSAKEAEVCGA